MRTLIIWFFVLLVSGCAGVRVVGDSEGPIIERPSLQALIDLPVPEQKAVVSVYKFPDLTGQRKSADNMALFSTAVTQGADLYLIEALINAGKGSWFTVAERVGLDHLTRERQLIVSTRNSYDGEGANKLMPLLYSGLIMEGGIISYDANYQTGGTGARYLGIGLTNQYRRDRVTVALRAVLVQTGEIILNVSTSKTIFSVGAGMDGFKFTENGTELVELESGITENETTGYAVKSAIETAVYALIKQGIDRDVWDIKTED